MANDTLTKLATVVSQGGDVELELENIPEGVQLPPDVDLSQPIDVETDIPIPQEVLEQIPSDVDVQLTGQVEGQTPQRRSVEEQIASIESIVKRRSPEEQIASINDIVASRGQGQTQGQEPPSEQSEGGFLDGVVETGKDMLWGLSAAPYNLADHVMDTSEGISNFATDTFQALTSDEHSFDDITWRPRTDSSLRFNAHQPSGVAGKMVEELTKFAITFGAVGTAFKAANVFTQASNAGRGAVADLILIDTQEARLSNLMEEYPMLSNPITRYLQMDEGDDWFEGKMKGVLEGVLIGGALDGFIYGIKKFKQNSRAANGKPTTEPKLPQTDTPVNGEVKAEAKAEAKAEVNPQDVSPSTSSSKPDTSLIGLGIDRDKMLRMVRKVAKEDKPLDEVMEIINLKRLSMRSPQASHLLDEMQKDLLTEHADTILKKAGREGFDKVKKEAAKTAEEFGFNATELLEQFANDNKAIHAVTRRMIVYNNFLSTLSDEVIHLADEINRGTASAIDEKRFLQASETLRDLESFNANARTEMGRALSSRRIEADGDMVRKLYGEGEDLFARFFDNTETIDSANEWLASRRVNRKHLKQTATDIQMLRNSKTGVIRHMKNNVMPSSLLGMFHEVRINGLLSGPYTHAVNMAGTALKTVTLPVERIIGGTIDGTFRRDMQTIKQSWRQGLNMYWGMGKYFTDSLRLAGKAFGANANQLDTVVREEVSTSSHFAYERIKARMTKGVEGAELNTLQEIIARSSSYIGKAFNLPTRCLMAEDEFFKQLNFRSDLYTKYCDEAIDLHGFTKNSDIAEYVERKMEKAFSSTGEVVRGELTEASLERARQATWTQALDPSRGFVVKTGAWLQQGANDSFPLRTFLPFIRTPTNIVDDFCQHTILAPIGQKCRQEIRKGGAARADVYGKIALGSVACYTAFHLAQSNLITGSPPKDIQRKKQLEASGWQAYSIKIGDTYVSYNRMDPIAMFFSLVADANVCIQESEISSTQDMWDLSCNILASVINNVGSKSYLTGLTDAINIMNEPERYFQNTMENMALSFLPFSSAGRVGRKQIDPYQREATGILERWANMTPYFSKTLPAKRNWVTGEMEGYNTLEQTLDDPYATFADFLPDSRREKRNGVLLELAQLGQYATSAPPKQIQGFGQSVDMTSAQYSRFCELHGTIKLNGKTMMEQLAVLMTNPNYNVQRQLNGSKGDNISDEVRGDYVNKIIRQYRKAAKLQLKREFPEINHELRDKAIKERTPTNGPDQQKSQYANYY